MSCVTLISSYVIAHVDVAREEKGYLAPDSYPEYVLGAFAITLPHHVLGNSEYNPARDGGGRWGLGSLNGGGEGEGVESVMVLFIGR